MDKKSLVTSGLFLDFSKAFDSVNHDILLFKLCHYGIRGTPLDWFKNYLYNRTQFIKIDNTKANYEEINCGNIARINTWSALIFTVY